MTNSIYATDRCDIFLINFEETYHEQRGASVEICRSLYIYMGYLEGFAVKGDKLAYHFAPHREIKRTFPALPTFHCVNFNGYTAWQPEYKGTPSDIYNCNAIAGGAYMAIAIDNGLFRLWDTAGWVVWINPDDGKIMKSEFHK